MFRSVVEHKYNFHLKTLCNYKQLHSNLADMNTLHQCSTDSKGWLGFVELNSLDTALSWPSYFPYFLWEKLVMWWLHTQSRGFVVIKSHRILLNIREWPNIIKYCGIMKNRQLCWVAVKSYSLGAPNQVKGVNATRCKNENRHKSTHPTGDESENVTHAQIRAH